MTVEELRERYLPALAELLPPARAARVERFFVTREHAATFRAAPGARALRPGPRTAIPGLFLAGSWTDTGWPATMEGAVRSGRTAARAALMAIDTGARTDAFGGSTMTVSQLVGEPECLAAPARPQVDSRVLVLAPLAIEARAVRAGAPWAGSSRSGWARAGRAARPRSRARASRRRADRRASAARSTPISSPATWCSRASCADRRERTLCPDPTILAGVLRRGGLRVHVGPVASSPAARRARPAPSAGADRRARGRHGVGVARRRRAGAAARDPARRARHAPPRVPPSAADGCRSGAGLPRAARGVRARRGVGAGDRPARGGARVAPRVVRRRHARGRDRRARARGARRAGLRAQADRPQRARRRRARAPRRGVRRRGRRGAGGRDRDLLRARRLAGGARGGRRARARRDRRHLPAGREGPRRGAPLRRRRTSTSCSSATRLTRRSRARSARRPSART